MVPKEGCAKSIVCRSQSPSQTVESHGPVPELIKLKTVQMETTRCSQRNQSEKEPTRNKREINFSFYFSCTDEKMTCTRVLIGN